MGHPVASLGWQETRAILLLMQWPMGNAELAERLGVTLSYAVQVAQGLQTKGLVQRVRSWPSVWDLAGPHAVAAAQRALDERVRWMEELNDRRAA